MLFIEYDPEADALFAGFRDLEPGSVAGVHELDDRRNVHLDRAGEPVGVEFLAVSAGIDFSGVPRGDEIADAIRGLAHVAA
jgi:uncharacterized protein YuzE